MERIADFNAALLDAFALAQGALMADLEQGTALSDETRTVILTQAEKCLQAFVNAER